MIGLREPIHEIEFLSCGPENGIKHHVTVLRLCGDRH